MKSSTAFRREKWHISQDLIFNFIILKEKQIQTHIAVQQPGKEKGNSFLLSYAFVHLPSFYDSKEKASW